MADTLLFRGGSSADIAVSTVQSREIVIDTDTDQIVLGSAKKRTIMNGDDITIDSSGNVGIGTSAPDGLLHLASSGNAILRIQNTDSGDNGIINFAGSSSGTAEGQILYNFASDYMRFYVARQECVRIDSSGDVLIGGTLPSAPNISLNANGSARYVGNVGIGRSPGSASRLYLRPSTASGSLNGIVIQNDPAGADNSFSWSCQNTAGDSTAAVDFRGNFQIGGIVSNSSALSAPNIELNADGSVTAAGTVQIGGLPSAPNITLGADGSASFAGDITCTDNSKGLILKSPDGSSFRLSVANDGTLSASSI